MTNVLINGINGKMGQEILKESTNFKNIKIVAGIDQIKGNNSIPVYNNYKDIKETIDLIIDFSLPEGTLNILEYANNNNIPIVIGTTGFNKEQQNIIYEYSKNIPIFQSSNMSLEINIMCNIVSKLAKQLSDSDIEIVETHHRNKIDSPSGTAIMLADSINSSLNNEINYVYDRHSKKEKRSDKEIGIHSIRGGTEVGKHTVLFLGNNETFEITHTVNSRSIFAEGALKASLFLLKQKPGFYNMKDIIGG